MASFGRFFAWAVIRILAEEVEISSGITVFQRASDVPYTYIPQNQYYHITITQRRKLFEMIRYA